MNTKFILILGGVIAVLVFSAIAIMAVYSTSSSIIFSQGSVIKTGDMQPVYESDDYESSSYDISYASSSYKKSYDVSYKDYDSYKSTYAGSRCYPIYTPTDTLDQKSYKYEDYYAASACKKSTGYPCFQYKELEQVRLEPCPTPQPVCPLCYPGLDQVKGDGYAEDLFQVRTEC